MDERIDVRVAARVGRRVVDVLAAAFADDPWMRWTMPDPGSARSLFSLFLRTAALPHGVVLVAGDPVSGVAVLMPPGVEVPDDPEVGQVVVSLHGPRLGPALDAEAIIDRRRSPAPAWTLHTLGVHPLAQGRGVGAALLAECVAMAGYHPLTLETSSRPARDWYLRRGFVEEGVVDLADGHGLGPGSPTVWLLSRRDG